MEMSNYLEIIIMQKLTHGNRKLKLGKKLVMLWEKMVKKNITKEIGKLIY